MSTDLHSLSYHSYTILVVDDTLYSLKMIVDFLSGVGFRVLTARSGESCLQRAEHGHPDLILLDVQMAGMDGFVTCQHLKASGKTRHIPVIFMTALNDTEHKVRGFTVGAVDYVTKPVQHEELLARVTTHLRIRELTENLERLVAERTAALAETNARLEAEIEQHKKTAVALIAARDQAEAASQAKSRFLGTMSHELRTPLMGIIGHAEIIQERFPDELFIHSQVEKIVRSSFNLSDLINDILHLAALDEQTSLKHYTRINLTDILNEIIKNLTPLILRNNNQLQVQANVTNIISDGQRVKDILRYLLNNAAKFTKNGRIAITLSQETDDQQRTWLVGKIEDSGIGMAPDQIEKLFRPFAQADTSYTRAYDGAGLGLTLAQQFTKQLNGYITVSSTPDIGTTIIVYLPWHHRLPISS
ncbi:MAG: response regulator [Chloroflexota bacterium]